MTIKGISVLVLLCGLGILLLSLSCGGQSSLKATKAPEAETIPILIVVPNPTNLGATLTALPDRGSALSASNAVTLTAIARTPFPTPLPTPPPNWTGVIPGKTDEAGVLALLGSPSHIGTENGRIRWSYNARTIPRVSGIVFDQEIVSRIDTTMDQPLLAESVIKQYGPPTLIGLTESSLPEESSTSIRSGYLFYPTQGIRFLFDCYNTPDHKCHGISKTTAITIVTYFVPMSIQAWLSSEKPERKSLLIPWSGYSESIP